MVVTGSLKRVTRVEGTMARALFLRHHREDTPGLLGDAFVKCGYDVDVAMMDADRPSPDLDGYDVLVVLGSTESVYDREVEAAWFARELDLIEIADRRGVAILGVCFGAQALCRYFGGSVTRAREGEIGWYTLNVVGGVELPDGPWFEYHFDHCSLPDGVDVWATTPRAVQAFARGRHVGVQFHPEVDDAQLGEWLASDHGTVRSFGLDPTELLAQTARETPAARTRAQALVELFLRRAA